MDWSYRSKALQWAVQGFSNVDVHSDLVAWIYQKANYARVSVFSYPSSSELMVVGSSTGSGIFPLFSLMLPFENGLP